MEREPNRWLDRNTYNSHEYKDILISICRSSFVRLYKKSWSSWTKEVYLIQALLRFLSLLFPLLWLIPWCVPYTSLSPWFYSQRLLLWLITVHFKQRPYQFIFISVLFAFDTLSRILGACSFANSKEVFWLLAWCCNPLLKPESWVFPRLTVMWGCSGWAFILTGWVGQLFEMWD